MLLSDGPHLKHLITQVTQPQDFETYKSVHLPRLRAAHIPGFEGVRNFNLKLNRKLREKGEEPVDLEKDCPQDMEQRAKDQYQLYLEICKQYSALQTQSIDTRLYSIAQVPFVLPERN